MRIRQKEERRECQKKKKKKPQKQPPQQQKYHHPPQTTPQPPNPPPKLQPLEPTHRRKPNTIRRFDGDVLSPVSISRLSRCKSICQFTLSWNQICETWQTNPFAYLFNLSEIDCTFAFSFRVTSRTSVTDVRTGGATLMEGWLVAHML